MNQVPMWSRIMVALCCVHRGALGQRQTVVDPVSGVTFSLYGGEVEWTWERAYNHCVSVGQRLAVIDNSPKQEAVNRFTDKGHAWIGGRRSPDVTWRWISGEEYEYDDGDGYLFTSEGTRCGAVGRLSSPSVLPSGCVVSGSLPAVCQRLAQGASKRYWVTDTAFVSWNDARVSCLDQGGDLAHPSSQEPIQGWKQQMVDLIAVPLYQAWIGLSRHSWSWVTGDHITLQAYRSMTYTHFARGEGDETNQICAHLDMKGNNDHSWDDKPCDFQSRYFVCDDGPPLTTETPPGPDPRQTEGGLTTAGTADPATGPPLTTTSQPGPAQPTNTPIGANYPHQTEGGRPTTRAADPATNGVEWAAVGGGAGTGVVVLAVIVVVVICVRKRRMSRAPKGKGKEDDDVDLEINAYHTVNDVTRQERVTGTGAHGDVIKPLTVAAGKETAYSSIPALKPAPKPAPKPATKPATKALKILRKVTSRNKNHTVGPEGDVYALPVTRKDERRQSDNLDMTENSEYGNLDLL